MKDDDWPVLPGERRVRFGCGALAGLVLGIWLETGLHGGTLETVLFVGGVALVLGLAAAAFGDRSWRVLDQLRAWVAWW